MFSEIGLGELDSNGEETCSEGDTHDFERDRVQVSAPGTWIEHIGTIWPKYDAACGSEDDFIDIKLDGTYTPVSG